MSDHSSAPIDGGPGMPEIPSDPVARFMKFAIGAVIVVALTAVLYFVIAVVLSPSAPRTALEAQLVTIQEAVRQTPQSGLAWADYVRTLTGLGDYAGAHTQLDNARSILKGDELVYVDIAGVDLLLTEKKYPEAYKAAQKLSKDSDTQREKAIEAVADKGVTMNPKLVAPDLAIQVRITRARAAANVKQWDDAIAALTSALEFDANAADVLYLRGEAYFAKGDKANAVTDFKKALKFAPDYEPAKKALEKAGEK